MATETPLQRLATLALGTAVVPWIRDRRPHRTWDQIVEDLRDATRGEIAVSYQTLINWAPDPPDMRTQPWGIPATEAEAAS